MTKSQYSEHLASIETHNVAEPLLPALRRGHSRINALYIVEALKRMPTLLEEEEVALPPHSAAPRDRPEISQTLVEEETEGVSAPNRAAPRDRGKISQTQLKLQELWGERTRLFGLMNRQSNQFHICKTDAQRAENSRLVLVYWASILAAKGDIAFYEENGKMPPIKEAGDELSDNPVALGKQLCSIRAKISQTQLKLRDLAGLDAGTPDKQAKINVAEARLIELKHGRGLAEQKLKSYGQNEG